jgi:hypothetical protein
MRRGLARRCVDTLVKDVVKKARGMEKCKGDAKLQVWIHAVEDLNGACWKK